MIVEFATKDLLEASQAVRNIFAKGPSVDGNNLDCLVASKENGTVVLESANQGLYTKISVEARVEEEGRVVINRDFLSSLKLVPPGQGTPHTPSRRKISIPIALSSGKNYARVGEWEEQCRWVGRANAPDFADANSVG